MPEHITIETTPSTQGGYRAQVAIGPWWSRLYIGLGRERVDAFRSVRRMVENAPEFHGAEFLHAES